MRRYSGMNYDDIAGDIIRNHEAFRASAIASDFGVGAVYNSKIREKIPAEKHLIFNYVGPTSDLIPEPKRAHMFNQLSLIKTESISLAYEAIRRGRIRCFAWELAEEYLTDCLNLFRAPGQAELSRQDTETRPAFASDPLDSSIQPDAVKSRQRSRLNRFLEEGCSISRDHIG